MRSTWLALRAGLRRRWRPVVGLALLLGVIGGVVLTAAAGARRTDTAYPRLLRWAHASQIDIISNYSPLLYQRLRRLPQVASVSVQGYYNTVLPGPHGRPTATQVTTVAGLDGSLGVTADRVKVLSGHLFDPADPDAVMIDQQLASLTHLRPGGTLHLMVVPNAPGTGNAEPQRAVDQAFRVTAIVVFDDQIVPATITAAEPRALVSTPFMRTPLARSASYGYQAAVRLRPGADKGAFVRAATATATRILGPELSNGQGGFDIIDLADETAAAERAITPQAFALAAFAALAGLITLAVIVQLLARQLILDSAEFPILRALGMSRRALTGLSLARLAVLTTAGALLAVAIAVAASAATPIGYARLAEPDPGIEVNLAVLVGGFAAVALLPLVLVAPAAWRAAGRAYGPLGVAEPGGAAHASRVGAALGRSGSVTGAIGVRMAFEPGHGRTAVPVRSALLGTMLAVAAFVAALVFGASLLQLIGTPRLYGQDWQQELDLAFGSMPGAVGAKIAAFQPGLAGYAAGNYGDVTVDGHLVAAVGIDPLRGGHFLTLLAGRAPRRPGEIALGNQTLRDIGGHLGQTVTVLLNGRDHPMRVVGTVVLPAFSQGSVVATDLGSGAVLPASVLSVPDPGSGCTGHVTCYNFFLTRYRPGVPMAAAAARLRETVIKLRCPPLVCSVTADQRPNQIRNYSAVRDTPLVLGLVLALLAAGTLIHVLLTSLYRRRRDLALLKTLGLRRGQLLRVVSWQAGALAAAALAVGVPLGVLGGRWAWALFARSAGVSSVPDIPVLLVLATVPATLLLALVIAAGPGWAAARIRPAAVLRAE